MPPSFFHFNGFVCSSTLFANTSALTNSLLFRANSTCKVLEHLVWSNASGFQFWGPLARTNILSALCGLANWEDPSMHQYQCWGKLLMNFQGHWSIQIFLESKAPRDSCIRISPEIHMDQCRESTNPRFRNPRFLFGVFFPIFRAKNRPKTPKQKPPLKKGGLVDNRESTNPRFRNPRFLFGVFFLYLRQKIGKNPETKTPP